MKTAVICVLATGMLALSSCVKDDVAGQLRSEAEAKIMGKWKLDRRVSETYSPIPPHPVPGTGTSMEYTGTADDYFLFEPDNNVEIDTAGTAAVFSFDVINPSQVIIGERPWRIEELTETRLQMVWDRNDGAQNKRFITRLYLKR